MVLGSRPGADIPEAVSRFPFVVRALHPDMIHPKDRPPEPDRMILTRTVSLESVKGEREAAGSGAAG